MRKNYLIREFYNIIEKLYTLLRNIFWEKILFIENFIVSFENNYFTTKLSPSKINFDILIRQINRKALILVGKSNRTLRLIFFKIFFK